MLALILKANQGEDTGELEAFRRAERQAREASGHLCEVDLCFRVSNARNRRIHSSALQRRNHRAPAARRRASRRGRSRSGRGSPPDDPDGDGEPVAAPPHREGRPDA